MLLIMIIFNLGIWSREYSKWRNKLLKIKIDS